MKNFINNLHYRAGDIWHSIQDRHLFWQIKRNGGSYADFYEAKMDRKALKVGESVNGLPKDKEYHFEFLNTHTAVSPGAFSRNDVFEKFAGVIVTAFVPDDDVLIIILI